MSTLFVKTWLAASTIADRARREDGQAITEYALILGVVVIAAVAVLTTLSGNLATSFNRISGFIK